MDLALEEAQKAFEVGEIPIGALVVKDEKVIASGFNRRETSKNPTDHAEIRAIRLAAEALKDWRLTDCQLYVTVEPCLLCSGAIYLARIPRVIFGCENPKGGALRFTEENQKRLNLNHSVEIVSGVREKEASALLKSFFAKRRNRPLEGS